MNGLFRGSFRLGGGVAMAAALAVTVGVGVGHADTPSPSPGGTPTATPSATPSPSPTPEPSSAAPTPSAVPTPPPDARRQQPQAQAEAPGLTLSVSTTFTAGYWSDHGSYRFRGAAEDGRVDIYYRVGNGPWRGLVRATADDGAYSVDKPVGGPGTFTFAATTGGAPDSGGDVVSSDLVNVTVRDSGVTLNAPPASVNALKDPRLTGTVAPARAGVVVHVDVVRGGRWRKLAEVRTDSSGRFGYTFRYGHARLAAYQVRATYRVPNRAYYEKSSSRTVNRVPVLDAKVTATTAAEVATTYRGGCPVGRSRLETVTMNYYGSDKKMHRGVMIIRADLTDELTYSFGRALRARFPITKMVNPNAYGGNDPRQMRADNSSGFNCRKVVGNPYRQSPHSYGTAIDVNPRQNPYRDVSGKWWPENGRAYIDRTPRRGGMLTSGSTLTRALQREGFFWGGRWSPGRDYQHFQY